MTTRPDPNTPEVPQKATEGRQSASEGSSGQREALRGQNGSQEGAEGLDGEKQPRGPVDWARHYAELREAGGRPSTTTVPQPELDALNERMAIYRAAWHSARGRAVHQRCINADLRTELAAKSKRTDQAEAAIARVRALHYQDGDYCALCTTDFGRLSAPWPCGTIRALDEPPAHNDGPSVAECAANDRLWPLQKAGE
ncbi:hypothetical protein [Streptomyces azureus]|uniref:Uncharacterized protein n=1 Tax=Streptomyces azureus TaxID=146537 RepID=A0A0K8PGA4_STRAJ|nr:hypothetical protein [Streptomyces azureus]GAP46915.1 uncharacterized protein SAZU_1652 [Streptomyces azureus]